MNIAKGTFLGHYEIVSLLGAGGMGEVYLARDTELERVIALKVLPDNIATDPQRMQRFMLEAKAASSLNHPNIITVYEIGRVGSTRFLATEFINGVTLRQRMASVAVQVKEALEIAIQVAAALTAAHDAGIVHRDIKPENIMLRPDGYVKVLDFGLAKLVAKPINQHRSDANAPTAEVFITEPGTVMGTVRYMSPEQARGLEIDARTDIWSLGVVLYEMLVGHSPFQGQTTSDMLVSILEKEPRPIVTYGREIPGELQEVITKTLRKDISERYESVRHLAQHLNQVRTELEFRTNSGSFPTLITGREIAVQTGKQSGFDSNKEPNAEAAETVRVGTVSKKRTRRAKKPKVFSSLAILPLINGGSDPEMEYLSDGITESIINSLSKVPKLKVMARSTMFRYKGRNADPQEVGNELVVQTVLTGRILNLHQQLMISIELVDTSDGSQIWGEQYNRNLSDIFALQAEIASEISEKLRIKLSGDEKKKLTKRYTENTEAYHLYLKGRYYFNKRTKEGLRNGIEYFQRAIQIDPNYALAYAGLADVYSLIGLNRVMPSMVTLPKAKDAANKAIEIDPFLGEAHNSLALVKTIYEWDWPGAEKEFNRSLHLNPNDALTHSNFALYLSAMGRHAEALREIKRAQELDPLSLIINSLVGLMYFFNRQYDMTIEQGRMTSEIDPNFFWVHAGFGWSYEQTGRYEEAIREFEEAVKLTGGGIGMLLALAHGHAISGQPEEARKILDQLQRASPDIYTSPYDIALVYVGLNEKDLAFEWLEKAFEDRFGWLIWLNVEPKWDSLRSDSRFSDLLARMNLA